MGSKGPSGQTTTTTTQSNPAAQAQLPFLENLWSGAAGLAQPNAYTEGLQNYAGGQAGATAPTAGNVMPSAIDQYLQQIQRGIPSQGQADLLTANANDARNTGIWTAQQLGNLAGNVMGQAPYWQNQFMGAGQAANQTLQGYGSGALNALTGLAPSAIGAGMPAQYGLNANAGMALNNPALSSGLTGLASGRYIDPSTNPAYAGMIQNATRPLVEQYQTATAPQVDSRFEGAGRYGSGAQINAQGQAQSGLAQGLSNAISGITNNAYNTGIQGTINAGQALGGIYNTGIGNITNALGTSGQLAQAGVQNAGNLINQGYTTGGGLANQGYNALNAFMGNAASQGLGYLNAGQSALTASNTAAQTGYGNATNALTGGGTLLNAGSDAYSRALSQAAGFGAYPEQQYTAAYNAPWLPMNNLSSILGNSIGGQGTGTTSQPYYSNTGANVLGGLSSAAGIAASLWAI